MSNPHDYTIGWICAITTEFVAAQAFLDEEHEGPESVAPSDNNSYALGRIGKHNVVIAVLPRGQYGLASAATVARDLVHSFPNVRIGLMVGIGGGAPSPANDIRLGDIVVSCTGNSNGGVFQYDFGKTIQDQSFQSTGFLNQPSTVLQTAVGALEACYEMKGRNLSDKVDVALRKIQMRKKYTRPPATTDKLFRSDIAHGLAPSRCCSDAGGDDPSHLILRDERSEEDGDLVVVHYGLIASANQLMKDAQIRDRLAADRGVLCFEMEAAGLMNHFPCLVIRGICDYADSHKNNGWQGFAAMVAAAYAKDLLHHIAPKRLEAERRIVEVLSDVKDEVNSIHQTTKRTEVTVEVIQSKQFNDQIERWLRPPNTSININQARKLRHEGTGEWFLKNTLFAEWTRGSRRHLWLSGFPGCGKTVLSGAIYDSLEKNNCIVLAHFFDFNDPIKQTVDGMARALLFQLYNYGTCSASILESLFRSHHDGRDQPGTPALLDCLSDMLKESNNVRILLDALDECSTRTELLLWIERIVKGIGHLRLIATGRPEAEFQSDIPKHIEKENCITLDKASINADIRSYIAASLNNSCFKKWAPYQNIQTMILEKVADRADGMFRWAACQLTSLEQCLDPEGIEWALDNLPPDLTTTYDRVLERITPERRNKANRLLQFLVHSKRTLTLQEAVDAIAVRIGHPRYFSTNDRMFFPADITMYCPGLVSIVSSKQGDETREELHLAHFTVKEYLLKRPEYNYEQSCVTITLTCLTYLCCVPKDDVAEVTTKFPLTKFAAQYWMDHAGPAEVSEDMLGAILGFMKDVTTFVFWTRLHQPDEPWNDNPGHTTASGLYFACLKGLIRVTRRLLSEGADVNAQCGNFGTALQAASSRGHKEIVSLLLDQGAGVNTQGGYYGTALQAASSEGHKEIIGLLLDQGADINAQGGIYGNALQAASSRGYKDIVSLLFNQGADVNAQAGLIENALEAASCKGYKEIISLLLDQGADINAQGGYYGNALQASLCKSYKEIIGMFLDQGAGVNEQGGIYGNALQAALSGGHKEIVSLLLDKGADVNAQDGIHGDAL